MATKEDIYDEQIAPLMAKIIEQCKAANISLLADFGLDDEMHCTTALLSEKFDPSGAQLEAFSVLRPQSVTLFSITTVRNADASKD